MQPINTPKLFGSFVIALTFLLYFGWPVLSQAAEPSGLASAEVIEKIRSEGRARVIVKLRTLRAYRKELQMSQAAAANQRAEIKSIQRRIKNALRGAGHKIRHEFASVPYLALEVDAAGLARLAGARFDVEAIYEDRLAAPLLAESIPQIEGNLSLEAGMDGAGSVVAIADTGIDKDHPFFGGRVIDEACFATGVSGNGGGDCPNGQATQIGADAGVPCAFAPIGCQHGTHVAGIAAGAGIDYSGVAPGADLIAIQVFHASQTCGFFEEMPCPRAFYSDILAALEHVYQLRDQYPIAAINMSLGGGLSISACDADFPAMAALIDNLATAGIATVVASGNSGFSNAISWPACISTAVAVGAIDEDNRVAGFSNVSQDIDLFAPGTNIDSSIPGGLFASFNGTSMAAPHVAGAWAVMEQAYPSASFDANLALLQSTGRPITDFRSGSSVTKAGIRLGAAIGIESPLPVLSSISPTAVAAWGPDKTIVVSGSDFVQASVVLVNGVSTQTTFVSNTELTADVFSNQLATQAATLDISVFTPTPGGGTTSTVALDVMQPELSVSSTTADARSDVTVTLDWAPGNALDWIGLFEVGAPNTSNVGWVYVDPAAPTWTVAMPDTTGDYEFRLLLDDGYTRVATSPTITVVPPPPPVLDVSATSVDGGDAVTVTLTDARGISLDWIAIAAVGDPNTEYLQWTYVDDNVSTFTWTVDMPTVPGGYEFRLFPNNQFTRLATSPTVTVVEPPPATPTLAVSATTVDIGDNVTVTLSGGPGGNRDWIGLFEVGDPHTSNLQWTYVASGSTTANWTVQMPSTPGTYEFRLFENDGYTLLATSPSVTAADPAPVTPTLAVSATTVDAGDTVTVTLSGGPGNNRDWIALAAVGDPDTTNVEWIYIAPGSTTANWTVQVPTTPGDYEFRLFEDDSYTRLATSPSVTAVDPAPATPTLAVSATTVDAGDSVTVTLSGGPGNNRDWIALAAVGDPDTTNVQWTYVASGATTASWTVQMPTTPGGYEFRLFEDDGYTRLATSPSVTVVDPAPATPTLVVSATVVDAGGTVTVTLSGGPGNNLDWIALAAIGDPDTVNVQWTYVASGSTTASWTVQMPTTPGTYEFRLFENDSYTRLATSPSVTVLDPAAGSPTLTVSATAVDAGDVVTVTLSGGPGNNRDWIAFAAAADPDTSNYRWTYVPAGSTTMTWSIQVPNTPGDYEFRLFENDGYERLATSPTVVVNP